MSKDATKGSLSRELFKKSYSRLSKSNKRFIDNYFYGYKSASKKASPKRKSKLLYKWYKWLEYQSLH